MKTKEEQKVPWGGGATQAQVVPVHVAVVWSDFQCTKSLSPRTRPGPLWGV